MPRKRFSPEQVISKLREAEVLLAEGKTTAEMRRSLGVTEHTYYRWSEWFGGLAIRSDRDDETILTGQLPDQAALYGVLSRIRDLNLILVSVARLSAASDPQQPPASETLAPL